MTPFTLGQYYDLETGMHYNWHRYYDPSTGRYLSPDPVGLAGGINLYLYAKNNPVNYTDPEGLDPCEPFKECFNRCIRENYGDFYNIAFSLSPFSIPALANDVYTKVTETIAKDTLKSVPLEGAFTPGDITKKIASSNKAVGRLKFLSPLTNTLGILSKASGVVGAASGGFVTGASIYCTVQCTL